MYGGGSAQGTITCNIVDLDGNDPPNPLADDRNNGFRPASVPEKEQVTSASWGIWSPWWQENWEWVENWQKCLAHRPLDGCGRQDPQGPLVPLGG